MLGSKLRNWMENHILKPRKKNNKIKNTTAGNVAETYLINTNSTAKDYAFNNSDFVNHQKSQCNKKINNCTPISYNPTYTGSNASPPSISSPFNSSTNTNPPSLTNGNSVISSPVRRREISPIQNSNLRRYGWLSPKLDGYEICDAKKTYVFNSDGHIFDRARETSVHSNPVTESHTNSYDQQQKEFLIQNHLNYSTSSCSSPTWSTGSKETSLLRSNQTHDLAKSKQLKTGKIRLANNLLKQKNCENFEAIMLERKQLLNKHDLQRERPKSEQFYHSQQHAGKSSAGYGRLLPSKLANSMLINFPSDSEKSSRHNLLSTKNTPSSYHCLPALPPTSCKSLTDYRMTSISGATVWSTGEDVNNVCMNNSSGQQLISLSSPESAYSTGYSTDGTSQNVPPTASEMHSNGRKINTYIKSINSVALEGQRYKFGLNKIEEMSPLDPLPKTSFVQSSNEHNAGHEPVSDYQTFTSNLTNPVERKNPNNCLAEQQQFMLTAYQSPSPRQRCRIRTNPWIATIDPMSASNAFNVKSHTNTQQNRNNTKKLNECDANQSQVFANKLQDVNCPFADNHNNNTPGVHKHTCICYADNLLSFKCIDDEKETDILSNESDLTDHQLSVDTGLDAEDECDSEDDKELIDSSLCSSVINSVRRKRYLKTCKRNPKERHYQKTRENRKSRETRSAGGTPVCLRKHTNQAERCNGFKLHYMNDRANSMIFDDKKINEKVFMNMDGDDDDAILTKADLEADMKYRQLIIEAEILLVTMGHSMQSLTRQTLSSPCKITERRRMIERQQSHLVLKDLTEGKIRPMKSSRNPKVDRISSCNPQRTHLTNFLNQNNSTTGFKIANRITNKHLNRCSTNEST